MEIVKLIGSDVLPDDQKLILEIAKVIRLGFLQQNAFHKDDTCVPMEKQFKMMEIILYLYKQGPYSDFHGHADVRPEGRKRFLTRLSPSNMMCQTITWHCWTSIKQRLMPSMSASLRRMHKEGSEMAIEYLGLSADQRPSGGAGGRSGRSLR